MIVTQKIDIRISETEQTTQTYAHTTAPNFYKDAEMDIREKIVFSISGAEKAGYPCREELNSVPISHPAENQL